MGAGRAAPERNVRGAAGRNVLAAAGAIGIRAAEGRRGGAERAVRRSGCEETYVRRLPWIAGRADVHLHALSAADVLPPDGSPFRSDAATVEGRSGTGP